MVAVFREEMGPSLAAIEAGLIGPLVASLFLGAALVVTGSNAQSKDASSSSDGKS